MLKLLFNIKYYLYVILFIIKLHINKYLIMILLFSTQNFKFKFIDIKFNIYKY